MKLHYLLLTMTVFLGSIKGADTKEEENFSLINLVETFKEDEDERDPQGNSTLVLPEGPSVPDEETAENLLGMNNGSSSTLNAEDTKYLKDALNSEQSKQEEKKPKQEEKKPKQEEEEEEEEFNPLNVSSAHPALHNQSVPKQHPTDSVIEFNNQTPEAAKELITEKSAVKLEESNLNPSNNDANMPHSKDKLTLETETPTETEKTETSTQTETPTETEKTETESEEDLIVNSNFNIDFFEPNQQITYDDNDNNNNNNPNEIVTIEYPEPQSQATTQTPEPKQFYYQSNLFKVSTACIVTGTLLYAGQKGYFSTLTHMFYNLYNKIHLQNLGNLNIFFEKFFNSSIFKNHSMPNVIKTPFYTMFNGVSLILKHEKTSLALIGIGSIGALQATKNNNNKDSQYLITYGQIVTGVGFGYAIATGKSPIGVLKSAAENYNPMNNIFNKEGSKIDPNILGLTY